MRGRAEGLRQGKEQSLLRMLQKRFGELPDWVQPRIQKSRLEELDTWLEGVLDARSIDGLIGQERSSLRPITRRRR